VTEAVDLLAALVIDSDGHRWGEVATEVQWSDACAVLDCDSPVRRHWIGRSRGYSKTTDLAAFTLVAMLCQLGDAARAYACAGDRDQARLLVDALGGLVARTPELAGALRVEVYQAVVERTGVILEALAADGPTAWGLRPSWVVADEVCQWKDTPNARQFWHAVTSALPKVPESRFAIITTSGDPASWSRRIYDAAVTEPELWRVSEVLGPPPWMPSRMVEAERRRLPASVFARLFENRWTASEDRLTDPDDLASCVVLEGALAPRVGVAYVVAVDLGLKRDRTAALVAHAEPVTRDGGVSGTKVVLDRIEVWAGHRLRPVRLEMVEDWVEQAARAYHKAPVIFDPWQAVGMAQRLAARGVRTVEFTFTQQSVGRVASSLHLAIRDHMLALPNDAALLDELANVRLRETSPGTMRMDHDPDRHDDRAVALGMAVHWLMQHGGRRGARVRFPLEQLEPRPGRAAEGAPEYP
jgi:hypothetical protein